MSDITVQLTDNSEEVLGATEDAILIGLEAVGLQAAGYAVLRVKVDTGLLKNSIAYAVDGNVPITSVGKSHSYKADHPDKSGKIATGEYTTSAPASGGQHYVAVGSNAEYAAYHEKGTQKTRPQPFLQPAIEDNLNQFKEIFKHYLENA